MNESLDELALELPQATGFQTFGLELPGVFVGVRVEIRQRVNCRRFCYDVKSFHIGRISSMMLNFFTYDSGERTPNRTLLAYGSMLTYSCEKSHSLLRWQAATDGFGVKRRK